MAEWHRFGEEKKYKATPDTNVNPKHVGESLRSLSMEDRLELRKQARAAAEKRKLGAVADGEPADAATEEALERAFSAASVPKLRKLTGTLDLEGEEEVDLLSDEEGVAAVANDGAGKSPGGPVPPPEAAAERAGKTHTGTPAAVAVEPNAEDGSAKDAENNAKDANKKDSLTGNGGTGKPAGTDGPGRPVQVLKEKESPPAKTVQVLKEKESPPAKKVSAVDEIVALDGEPRRPPQRGASRRAMEVLAETSDKQLPLRRTSSNRSSASAVQDLDAAVVELDDSAGGPPPVSPAVSDPGAVGRRPRRRASASKAASTPAAPSPGSPEQIAPAKKATRPIQLVE